MIKYLAPLLLILVACSNETETKTSDDQEKIEEIQSILPKEDEVIFVEIDEQPYKAQDIYGVWWDWDSPSANFSIDSNGIYYPEHFEELGFEVRNDSFCVVDSNWTHCSKILTVSEDTLVLEISGDTLRYGHMPPWE